MASRDIGVPGAVAEALRRLAQRVPPERMDRIWIFPPLTQGRRESGVVVAGCFGAGKRRTIVTMAYRAEETGRGITFEESFQEQGEAPPDRLPRVMDGVVARSEAGLEGPRSVRLDGDSTRFDALVVEWDRLESHGASSGGAGEGFPAAPDVAAALQAIDSKEETPA